MFTSTFTFAKGQYDDAFHALDAVIAGVARAIPGYLGEEAWENAETGLISNVYYWDSMEALQAQSQADDAQVDLFAAPPPVAAAPAAASELEEALEAIDPDRLSPREALEALYRLKSLLKP